MQPTDTTPALPHRTVDIRLRDLLKALAKALVDLHAANWDALARDLVDAGAAFGLTGPEPGAPAAEQAARLVSAAVNRAVFDLVRAHAHLFGYDPVADQQAPAELTLDPDDVAVSVELDRRLFDRPEDCPAVNETIPLLRDWFGARGLAEAPARSVAVRLGRYYAAALADELRRDPPAYGAIDTWLRSPATPLEERQADWRQYRARLARGPDEPLFADCFSLAQVYQPLRAFISEDDPDAAEPGHRRGRPMRKTVVDAMDALHGWLAAHDTRDAIRVVSGGPGAGKSSLARMIAARRALAGERVLLIELHRFGLAGDLRDGINRFARGQGIDHDVLDRRGAEPLLLIFDGLDELSIRGSAGRDAVRTLVDRVRDLLLERNRDRLELCALLLGRQVVVQSVARRFSRQGQLLTLLPYAVPEKARGVYHDPHGRLALDQRHGWWAAYGAVTGRPYDRLPDVLRRVDALTREPLLNYLVALALDPRDDSSPVDFADPDTSLNDVYASLVEQVFRRVHASGRSLGDHRLKDLEAVELHDYQQFLQHIAVVAWHGEGRTATLDAICQRVPQSLLDKMDQLQTGAEDGVSRLLTAFYFRSSPDVEAVAKTFEFTHQSFAEYLLAQEILTFYDDLSHQAAAWRSNARRGWDPDTQLTEWAKLFGPSAIERNTFDFVQDGLRQRARDDREGLDAVREVLVDLFGRVLAHDFPMAALPQGPYLDSALAASRNAGEAMLCALSACSEALGVVSPVKTTGPEQFGDWFKRMLGQRNPSTPTNDERLLVRHMGYLDLSRVVLTAADLSGVRMPRARLVGADLSVALLDDANLAKADLTEANLPYADLERTTLVGADLTRANLWRARAQWANLAGANCARVDASHADLRQARLDGANLETSILDDTDVFRATADGGTRWPDDFDPVAAGVQFRD